MWQSCVEIKGYSAAYLDRIDVFEVPYCWTFFKDGAHTCFINWLDIHTSIKHIWGPPLTEVYYGTGDAIKVHERAIFDFYTGLSHMLFLLLLTVEQHTNLHCVIFPGNDNIHQVLTTLQKRYTHSLAWNCSTRAHSNTPVPHSHLRISTYNNSPKDI